MDQETATQATLCELRFYVDGVRCAKCVQKLESLPSENSNILHSVFDKGRHLLTIEADEGLSPQTVIDSLRKKGYEAHFVEHTQQTEEFRKRSHRQWLLRLAVTFFFASNLMMFAIALYMGALGPWKNYFSWACGVFYLPIVFYSAQPFYRSAWQSIKEKRFSADLSIVVAFTWGSALSYLNLFRGRGEFYFDSTASFLFLILLVRFLLEKTQQSLESDLNPSLLFKESPQFEKIIVSKNTNTNANSNSKAPNMAIGNTDKYSTAAPNGNSNETSEGMPHKTVYESARQMVHQPSNSKSPETQSETRLESEITQGVLYHEIQSGDKILLRQNQTVPVDMELISPAAEMDLSLFSGESLPQTFYKGDRLKAGMKVLSSTLQGEAKGSFNETELRKIFDEVLAHRHAKTKAHSQAESYSQKLLMIVSVLSLGLLFYFGWHSDWSEGLRRALALFTIACPCALALAIPLASVMTLKRAMEQKLFVRSPLFFEKLEKLRGLVFDKTGTLTEGRLELVQWEPSLPDLEVQQILLAMEAPSSHPMAQSLSHWLKARGLEPITLEDWEEKPGIGIRAIYKQKEYYVSRIENPVHKELTGFQLKVNSNILCHVYFKDQARPEAPALMKELYRRNLEIHILSGDREEVVHHLAHQLGVPLANCQAQKSPLEKAAFFKDASQIFLMVGDGHNDALALSRAPLSMAVKGSAETSLRAADSYSQRNNLWSVVTALELGHFYRRLIRQNIGLSLIYNTAAGAMAMMGMVDPLVAAILMPLNSFIVIGATALAQPKKSREI